MRPRSTILVTVSLVVALASGCAALGAAARTVVEPPRVTFERLTLDALDLDGFTIGLNWGVENPNQFGFRLARLGWALDLDGRPAARGETDKAIELPAAAQATVAIPVRIRWADVPGLLGLAMNRDELPFKVSGTAALGSAFGDIDVPFAREGKLTLPRSFRYNVK